MTTKIPVELSSTPGISDSSDATAITITSGENIGIGTDTPSQKLHVYNSTLQVGSKTGDTSIQQNTDAIRISAVPNTTTEWGGLQWYREFSDYIGAEIIAARAGTAESDTDLILKTSTSSANATERVRITHGGLVGIGVTSPDRMLHVKGTDTSTVAKFANTGNVVYIELNAADQVGGDAGYIAYNNTKDMAFWTDDTERMRIDSTGDVFIGTTSHMSGGSNAGDAVAVVNGGVNREGIPFTDFDEAYVSDNRGIFEGTSGFQPSNNPGGSNWWHVISRTVATGGSATYITQTATSITGNIHTRYSSDNGSSWSSWQSV